MGNVGDYEFSLNVSSKLEVRHLSQFNT